ncbi:MAG: hypothetical protein ACPHN3_07890 [Spongiibacter sp.]
MFASETAQAPGTSRKVEVQGRFLLIRAASAPIDISAPGLGVLRLEEGDSYQFSQEVVNLRLQITNPQAVSVSWEIEVSNDEIKVGKQAVSVSTTSIIQGANSVTNIGEVTITAGQNALLIAAAAANTARTLRLSIKSDEASGVYIGAAGIVSGQGGYLDIGMVDYVDCEAALYAFNPHSTDPVTVQVLPFERSL